MKKKTTKKATGKKPAAKKPAAKKVGKQASAKKGAARKAAPKKAAPKKATAKKVAAPKKKAPAKKPATKKPAAIEVQESSSGRGLIANEIIEMARQVYGPKLDTLKILRFDPNDVDEMDPSVFYEMIQQRYGVEPDPNNDNFGGFGGTIESLIRFVESRWDGKTNNATPTPPGEWLEDYVHPATGGDADADEDQSQVS